MSPTTPRIAWLPWAFLALGAVGVLYGMIGFWRQGYDSFDRAIIIIASAWIVRHRHSQLLAIADRPKPLLGCILLALGAIAFFPPWFVYSQIGPRPVILWWESLALFVATIGLILIRSGPNLFKAVSFSLIFPLFALPLPGRIQNPLQEFLQGIAASIAAEAIPFFGVPLLKQEGFTFLLPHGKIGIVEACSGLTQVRAILSVAAFIAYLRGFGLIRSTLTVFFGIPIIVVLNSIRVTLSGLIAEWAGYEYIEGVWHEILGLALFFVGLAFVLGITRLMMRPTDTNVFSFEGTVPEPRRGPTALASVLLAAVAIAGIAAVAIPTLSRSAGEAPDFATVPATLGLWKQFGVDNPPATPGSQEATFEGVKATLTFNAGLHRLYTRAGIDFEKADIWLLYWKSAMVVKDYHHPDVCYRNRGDKMVAGSNEPVTTPAGRRIDVMYREFARGNSSMQVAYWTQEGRRIWTAQDEATAASFVFPFVWIRERLNSQRAPDQCDDRLVMMVGMPLFKNDSASRQKAKLLDFAGRLADEVYTVCPWADPK